jgi:hypothetical protein
VHGDSWFTNFATVEECLRRGLYYCGVVKTGHAGIPVKWLRTFSFTNESPRGAHKVLHTEIGGRRVIAVAWNEPKKRPKVFVSSAYSGVDSAPQEKERCFVEGGKFVRTTINVPRPLVVTRYYNAANAIDVANSYRQNSIALERVYATKDWEFRLFQTIFTTIVTNAYLVWSHFAVDDNNLTIKDAVEIIAFGLAGATVEESRAETQRHTRRSSGDSGSFPHRDGHHSGAEGPSNHYIRTAAELPSSNSRGNGRCRVCKKKLAYSYCPACTKTDDTYFVCGPKTGRPCFQHHNSTSSAGAAAKVHNAQHS